jgi:hypothetical protein
LNNIGKDDMRAISLIRPIRKIRDKRDLIGIQIFVYVRLNWRMVEGTTKGFRWQIESETSKNEVDIEDKTRYQTKE